MIDEINTKEIAKGFITFKEIREVTDPYCDRCGQAAGEYIGVLEEDVSFLCPKCIAQKYLKERRYFSPYNLIEWFKELTIPKKIVFLGFVAIVILLALSQVSIKAP